jgi:hypothetical protein
MGSDQLVFVGSNGLKSIITLYLDNTVFVVIGFLELTLGATGAVYS